MLKTIGLAILAFFISAIIGYFALIWYATQCTSGFACILNIFYLPTFLAGAGIILTIPIYFLLKKVPFLIQNYSKLIAIFIIVIVILLGLTIVPK